MNLQDPVGSYRILENPVGSCIGFLPGYRKNKSGHMISDMNGDTCTQTKINLL